MERTLRYENSSSFPRGIEESLESCAKQVIQISCMVRAFQLAGLLTVTAWCSIIMARSETADVDQEALLHRAADQLNRLMPFRKIAEDRPEINLENLLEIWKPVADQNHLDERKDDGADQGVPWEMLEVVPEQVDTMKRIDDEGMIAIGVITDPQYAAMMQDRIKRGFTPGSAGLLTSIAGGVLSGVASASSSSAGKASASSSEHKPIYGVPSAPVEHSYSVIDIRFNRFPEIRSNVVCLSLLELVTPNEITITEASREMSRNHQKGISIFFL